MRTPEENGSITAIPMPATIPVAPPRPTPRREQIGLAVLSLACVLYVMHFTLLLLHDAPRIVSMRANRTPIPPPLLQ